eukprot:symbB.v1.2.002032.t1/scaffold104.1/size473687/10
MADGADMTSRLVLVTGAARGLGVGICRQVLKQGVDVELLVAARTLGNSAELVKSLNDPRAHAVQCDVTDEASCRSLAVEVAKLRRHRALSVVHNAGVAYDLPWFPAPWPSEAAKETLAVNFFGAQRLTEVLLPELLDEKAPGRLIFVSSGAGAANWSKMSEERRNELSLADGLRSFSEGAGRNSIAQIG